MKKISLILLIGLTSLVKAQDSTSTKQESIEKFIKGYYIGTDGKRMDGYFNFYFHLNMVNYGNWENDKNRLEFKPNLDAESIKLRNKELDSVILGNTKYLVVKKVGLKNYLKLGSKSYKNKISKIILTGRITIYETTLKMNSGYGYLEYSEILFVRKTEDPEYYQIPRNDKKIKILMLQIMNDNTDFISNQDMGVSNDKDVIKLISDYNLLYKQ